MSKHCLDSYCCKSMVCDCNCLRCDGVSLADNKRMGEELTALRELEAACRTGRAPTYLCEERPTFFAPYDSKCQCTSCRFNRALAKLDAIRAEGEK